MGKAKMRHFSRISKAFKAKDKEVLILSLEKTYQALGKDICGNLLESVVRNVNKHQREWFNQEYITTSQLKEERGWSSRGIETFLIDVGYPRLFNFKTVLEIEHTEEYKNWCEKEPQRQWDEMLEKANKTSLKLLELSSYLPVSQLFQQYDRPFSSSVENWEQIEEKVAFLKQSILDHGWKGKPLIIITQSYQVNGKEFLWSGSHRLQALKELTTEGSISEDFTVPLFNIEKHWTWLFKQIPKPEKRLINNSPMICDDIKEFFDLDELRLICKGTSFIPLVTGIDNW